MLFCCVVVTEKFGERMNLQRRVSLVSAVVFLCLLPHAAAQGTREDYERAQKFLFGNLRHQVYIADVNPRWIEKTSRFWYRKAGMQSTEFVLVDPVKNTSEPAFDHARLAAALSHAAKQECSATALPFNDIEFADGGKSIRFAIDNAHWNCSLASYECQQEPSRPEHPNESVSPDK